ncbi:MAG: archease, partial [Methanoregulaceae archaeon]
FDPAKHSGGTEVKGISYSGLSIHRDKENYILEVIFDV